ncbi:MAG: transglutaminase domain-containing protein [Candidatus Acidiferrales bacterium]
MKISYVSSLLAVLGTTVLATFWGSPAAPVETAPQTRTVEITYSAQVSAIPANSKRIEIWLPYPQSDDNQKIIKGKVSSPVPSKILTDSQYGNKIVHIDVKNPEVTDIPITMVFTVRRSEYVHNNFSEATNGDGPTSAQENLDRWLQPDRLVPLDKRIQELSATVVAGKTTDLDKARAIYDYVIANMTYDKTPAGCCNGDIVWACDAKRGNCSDFHSLFIGLARAAGIPAKFEIGLPLAADKPAGEIGGYHCWAEFYLKGYGWVPIDASEAWKDPSKKDFFFGALDANRVQFSVGRDLTLATPQTGPPLNYFIYPYVEVDGKPFTHVSKKFAFKDWSANVAPAK